MNWSISTWSLRTRRSSILKYGCESDKASISSSVLSGRNCPRGCINRKRKLMDKPLYLKRQKVYEASKKNYDQSMSSTSQPSLSQLSLPQPLIPSPLPQPILSPKPKSKPWKKASSKNNKECTRRNPTRKSRRRASEVADASALAEFSFAAAFPFPKSPHHNCTYTDCQLRDNMFFNKASEKYGTSSCPFELHHVCMIEYGSRTYGEGAEAIGMRKLCKSCFTTALADKGVKKV